MNKKLAFLFPLALLAPLAFGAICSTADPTVVSAQTTRASGEFNGYTYTQSGNYRYYDSHDFGPNIIKHFWAPSGFKFTVEITDEQIDLMLDQAESVGIDYKYVVFMCKYSKFGIEVTLDPAIEYDLDGREGFKSWLKSELNYREPFYEIKDASSETDITFNVNFLFYVNNPYSPYNSYIFCFESETYNVEPFDAAEYIDYSVDYYDNPSENKIRVDVEAFPADEFFDETTDGSGYGFKTKETMERYDWETGGTYEGAKYTMTLFAFGTHEIGDVTFGRELSIPTHPVTFSIRFEFTSDEDVDYTFWSKEFIIADPGFHVSIDGSSDRSNVQKGTEHEYKLVYTNFNSSEDIDLNVQVQAMPLKLQGGDNVIEHYDISIGPESSNNYYLQSIYNMWQNSTDYILEQVGNNHYVIRSTYLEEDDYINIADDGEHEFYNLTEYDGCGYRLDPQHRVYILETGYYDIDFYPLKDDGNYFTITKVDNPASLSNYYLSSIGEPYYGNWYNPNLLFENVRLITDASDSNHFILKDIDLYSRYKYIITDTSFNFYLNESEYEGCGYTIHNSEALKVNEDGIYDIDFYFDVEDGNHIVLTKKHYYLVGSFNNWTPSSSYDLNFGDKNHFSGSFNLRKDDAFKIVKSDGKYFSNVETWECCGFTIDASGNLVVERDGKYNVDFYIKTSQAHIVLRTDVLSSIPSTGEEEFLHYIPSDHEIRLHHQELDDQLFEEYAEGTYYIWNSERQEYEWYEGVTLIQEYSHEHSEFMDDGDFDFEQEPEQEAADKPVFNYVGKWYFAISVSGSIGSIRYNYYSDVQLLDVSAGDKSDVDILLNVPDEVNLLLGADNLEITTTLSTIEEDVDYYYGWKVTGKEGIVDIRQNAEGTLTVSAIGVGVTTLTVEVDCKLFATIEKTISVRVLDAIYDVAKIKVPDEFHQAGKALTASISVRGFIGIQNVDIEWTATTKDGTELELGKDFTKSGDQSITITNPKSDDYTLVASYEGVKLDKLTVQVRLTDLNKFLRVNVWWIFLMTIGLVVFMLFIKRIFRRGRTTVENIEKVYQVFCQCLSDDKLTLAELKTIKREISKCLHRCETLNIEALNQYEKAIRYLRKSLIDTNSLIKKWETITVEDKSTFTEKLNLDLSKALNVAREIENAKELIEQYHVKANRQNYEVISDEPIAK